MLKVVTSIIFVSQFGQVNLLFYNQSVLNTAIIVCVLVTLIWLKILQVYI